MSTMRLIINTSLQCIVIITATISNQYLDTIQSLRAPGPQLVARGQTAYFNIVELSSLVTIHNMEGNHEGLDQFKQDVKGKAI